jgi:putative phage-type endonuclease
MTPTLLPKHELHSPEWHEARRSRLGGSEIAAVLGLSPWQSPFSLWHKKAGLIAPDPPTRFTEWGTRLEPVVAAKFCEEHPDLRAVSQQGFAYEHSDRPWQAASPDVLLEPVNNGSLMRPWRIEDCTTFCEVKTSARADAWYDGVPVYYRTQVLWTMDVLGVDHAYLAALIGGSDYREFVLELDDDATADLAVMRAAGENFMASLAAGTPPDLDDSYATFQTVRRLTPDIDPDAEVEVDRDVADTYLAMNQAMAQVERDQRKARTAIARVMGNAQYAVCEGVRIARRQPARDGGPAVLVSTRKHLPPREATAA